MGIVLLVPIVPQMYANFSAVPNADYLIQGGVLTMPALCIALFSAFAGWLADAVGRRRLLIGAVLLYSVVGIAPIFLDNLYAIIVSRIGAEAGLRRSTNAANHALVEVAELLSAESG